MWVRRLPVHIDPAGCAVYTEIVGGFAAAQWADRVVGPYGEISMHSYPVGADDSVRPQDAPLFTEIFGKIATSLRADRVVGPYRVSANPYYPANFERKAFLPQILKRNYLQI